MNDSFISGSLDGERPIQFTNGSTIAVKPTSPSDIRGSTPVYWDQTSWDDALLAEEVLLDFNLKEFYSDADDGGLDFTQKFYDLGLIEKCKVILALEEAVLNTENMPGPAIERTLYRAGSALLQHSTDDEAEYGINGIRKQSRQAREEDWRHFQRQFMLAFYEAQSNEGMLSVERAVELFSVTQYDIDTMVIPAWLAVL